MLMRSAALNNSPATVSGAAGAGRRHGDLCPGCEFAGTLLDWLTRELGEGREIIFGRDAKDHANFGRGRLGGGREWDGRLGFTLSLWLQRRQRPNLNAFSGFFENEVTTGKLAGRDRV